jgi:cobalt-zinc-cadmium efflux system membrane fusion protein
MNFKSLTLATASLLSFLTVAHAAEKPVMLDETGVQSLGIETVEASESVFEETIFALGRIEEIPEKHAVLSSRIPGRIVGLEAREGDMVTAGQTIARVESRQPGDPPPTIELKAPISGLVVESHVRLGEPVEPEKELLDISDLTDVYAIARVPEHQTSKLSPGTGAIIRISALGDQPLEGKLIRFGTTADRERATIDAIFLVKNPDNRLRPGMRAEFGIITARHENVLTIPKEAVQGDPSNRHVFLKDFNIPHAFLRSPVKTGRTNGTQVEILSGVFPGDLVVTRGSYALGFVGSGSGVSLKEALDAAHGHEHNEDGSEMTAEQKAARGEKAGGSNDHDHDHGDDHDHEANPLRERIFMGTTAVLALALCVVLFLRRGKPSPEA